MPKVYTKKKIREFPYTKQGIAAAVKYAKRMKGKLMGKITGKKY